MADCAASDNTLARIAELELELKSARSRIAELDSELNTARAQFGVAERAARVGYWRVSIPDYHTSWSPGLNVILGLDPALPTIAGRNAFPFGFGDDVRRLRDKIRTAIATGERLSERVRLRCVDGVVRILDILGDVECGPDGTPIAFVGATHDVTEQITLETERNRVEELHRVLTEAASDIMVVYNSEGNVEFASAALERVLGWTKSEFAADTVMGLMHPDDSPQVTEMRRTALAGQFTTATYRMRHADGRYIWLESKLSLVCDEATGNYRYVVSIMRDVSERMAHEQALTSAREAAEAASRTKSRFLANMSHELRTPLNAIIGFADIMRHEMFGPVGDPHYREYVSSIHGSGQHLLDLINDILDVAKIEAGKVELHIEEMNLVETVGECIRIVAERAAQGGIRLNAVMPESLPCALDRRAVKQIVLNLLSNAIKFTPAGGRIDVAALTEGEIVRMEIRDTGIGVPEEDLPRLTKPFEQVCQDPLLAKAGTGLGLALVRALVEQHGGRLKIDSPAQNGTIVTVEFPRIAVQRAAA